MSTRLQTAIDDRVAEVVLNRPEKHNAVDLAMFDELGELGASLGSDRSVRAVVLRGSGANFCAGIDLDIFGSSDAAIGAKNLAPLAGTPANRFQRAAYVWRELPVPVVCAIEGVAYGAGLQIALGADLRYGTPDAKLSVMEVRWGLIPDLAITVTASNLVREDRLRELAYTGRVVSGREALEIGLLTGVHDDPVAAARKTAKHIAAKSPDAIRAMKKMFNACRNLDESQSLALEAALQGEVLTGANQREAVVANMAGREPEFED